MGQNTELAVPAMQLSRDDASQKRTSQHWEPERGLVEPPLDVMDTSLTHVAERLEEYLGQIDRMTLL